jgi:dCMP deaminase
MKKEEYFMKMAKLVSTSSTCLALPVGAVIVRNNRLLAMGFNSVPKGLNSCISQGFCYHNLIKCSDNQNYSSRAIHAEINAIAYCAKNGISTKDAIMYTTLEPCLNCLKSIIAVGISEVIYETENDKDNLVKKIFIQENLIKLIKIHPNH